MLNICSLRIFAWISCKYSKNCNDANGEGVVEVWYDGHGIDGSQSCRHEQLCSVWYHSLRTARHGVENACALSVVHAKSCANLFCYSPHCNYCHGIVGGA